MCHKELESDLGMSLIFEVDSIWIFDNQDEFLMEFKVNYCPICGEKVK